MSTDVYTDEVVQDLVDAYTAVADEDVSTRNAVVQSIARSLDVTVNSVRGKLVSLGVYIAKAKDAKGAKAPLKADLAAALADKTGIDAKDFIKMTRDSLVTLTDLMSE